MDKFSDSLIKKASKQTGLSEQDISQAMKSKDASSLMKNLSSDEKAKIQGFLNDKEATKKLLETPEVKAIINSLFK